MQITVSSSWTEIKDNTDIYVWLVYIGDSTVSELKDYLKQIVPEDIIDNCEIKLLLNVMDTVVIESKDQSVGVALAIITN